MNRLAVALSMVAAIIVLLAAGTLPAFAEGPGSGGKDRLANEQQATASKSKNSKRDDGKRGQDRKGLAGNAVPSFDPNNFGNPLVIDNSYFPLVPGTVFTYAGKEQGTPSSDIVTVTDQTKLINGVLTRAISDKVFLKGKLEERTTDWYAQDNAGNVWYMGENTVELPTGSHAGTWRAGVHGAQPGIIMLANPTVGVAYQQEFLSGVAEDKARVVSVSASQCVPVGCFSSVLETHEWSPLEPGVLDLKTYAPNIGQIGEMTVRGGHETLRLIRVETLP